jgi:hypothetical protein
MKSHIYFAFFLLLIFADCKTGNKNINSRLLDRPESITACGIFSFTYAMKFQRIDDQSQFVGLIFCPDQYGKDFFQMGKTYILTLADKIDTTADILVNHYENLRLPTYSIEEMRPR